MYLCVPRHDHENSSREVPCKIKKNTDVDVVVTAAVVVVVVIVVVTASCYCCCCYCCCCTRVLVWPRVFILSIRIYLSLQYCFSCMPEECFQLTEQNIAGFFWVL